MAGNVITNRSARLDRKPSEAALRSRDLPQPGRPGAPSSYYDVSLLKPPVWRWQISHYFFWGGVSAGSYILARVAERFGGEKYRELTQVGTLVSFVTSLPCAPLLIHDLGDPKRFHHMLRVWKPSSPMNLGTWTLMTYTGVAAMGVLRVYLRERPSARRAAGIDDDLARLTDASLVVIQDAAGVPLALLVAGYTGVLLSCTSNPMWVKNPWIGPLFSSSAIATGAAAVSLALDIVEPGGHGRRATRRREAAHEALETIDTVAHIAEAVTLGGYLWHAGKKARPLTHGKQSHHLAFTIGGLLAAEAIKLLPLPSRAKKLGRMLAAGIGLATGFSLRWGMVHGGHEAANDPELARQATSPQDAAVRSGGSLAAASGRLAHGRNQALPAPRPSPTPPYPSIPPDATRP